MKEEKWGLFDICFLGGFHFTQTGSGNILFPVFKIENISIDRLLLEHQFRCDRREDCAPVVVSCRPKVYRTGTYWQLPMERIEGAAIA